MNEFMLESLRELQTTLLLLMEQGSRSHLPEAGALDFALEMVVTATRSLRVGAIDWRQAVQVYQIASNAQLECDLALCFPLTGIAPEVISRIEHYLETTP